MSYLWLQQSQHEKDGLQKLISQHMTERQLMLLKMSRSGNRSVQKRERKPERLKKKPRKNDCYYLRNTRKMKMTCLVKRKLKRKVVYLMKKVNLYKRKMKKYHLRANQILYLMMISFKKNQKKRRKRNKKQFKNRQHSLMTLQLKMKTRWQPVKKRKQILLSHYLVMTVRNLLAKFQIHQMLDKESSLKKLKNYQNPLLNLQNQIFQ